MTRDTSVRGDGLDTVHAAMMVPGEPGNGARAQEKDVRFEFGRNWRQFLRVLDQDRMDQAQRSLVSLLRTDDLRGKTFLDIGCGSGLFSLAAYRLGAEVTSFDYDADSVACAEELRRRFGSESRAWRIEQGSVLDDAFMAGLGRFDIVYSWGVLHHTGQMWRAVDNAARMVEPGGKLVIAIYNDCGKSSRVWWHVKRLYCHLPRIMRPAYAALAMAPYELRELLSLTVRGRFSEYVASWTRYERQRGMSRWHDIIDWVGGFPYEYATAERVLAEFEGTDLHATDVRTTHTIGCNEFVLERAG